MTTIRMRLDQISYGAQDINIFSFKPVDGSALPAAPAGSHVDLHLGPNMVRQYSVLRPSQDPQAYVVGIKKEASGRGGSRHVHEKLRVGDQIEISAPRNNFPLVEDAPFSILIAGGIGITPIWAMAQELSAKGKPWKLYLSARSPADCALRDELSSHADVSIHFDSENPGKFMDLTKIVNEAPAGSHFYCCGPAPMLAAYRDATSVLPADQVHDEAFGLAPLSAAGEDGFTVKLARSGQEIAIPADRSILDTIRSCGIDAMSSCEAGVCGMCETMVLEGEVDHRDHVLGPEEQAANTKMMICCSRARSAVLVLDL